MSLVDFGKGGGGGQYINAEDIETGTKGRILGVPRVEKFDPNDPKSKDVVRVPMEVEGVDGDIWSPGKNAVRLLLEALGENEREWTFPVEGAFERRKVDTYYGKKSALMFVPSTTTSSKKGASKKEETRSSSFKCGMCPKSFPSAEKLTKHIQSVHS